MDGQIVCGSEYGTAKAYAARLSALTGLPVVDQEKLGSLEKIGLVIHFGGLYAGGVKGLKKTVRALPKNARLMIVTVGLSDVDDPANIGSIRASIRRQAPEEVLNRTSIFHLRGGIDYSRLKLVHKTMMSLLYNKARRLPEEQRTAEVRAMIDTYGKQVSFVDLNALGPIQAAVEETLSEQKCL